MAFFCLCRSSNRRILAPSCYRVRIPRKTDSGLLLPSDAVIFLGKKAILGCSISLRRQASQGIFLSNRTCFGISEGVLGPFVIRAKRLGVGMLNAAFGITSCPSSTRVGIDLIRNDIGICAASSTGGGVLLSPSRRTICGGGSGMLSVEGVSTMSRTT